MQAYIEAMNSIADLQKALHDASHVNFSTRAQLGQCVAKHVHCGGHSRAEINSLPITVVQKSRRLKEGGLAEQGVGS